MKENREVDKDLEKYIDRGDKSGMKIPEGYFEQMQQDVMAKLEQESPAAKRVSMRSWLTLAASVVAIAIVAITVLQRQAVGGFSADFADISSEEAYEYIYLNADAFAAEEIFSALDVQNDNEADALDLEETNYAIDELLEEFTREDLEAIF